MARHTTAVCRLCRRSGDKLILKGTKCINNCTFDKRSQPPGPRSARRRRLSDRGAQLRDKQRARWTYGIMERQFRRIFHEAERQGGVTGDNLIALLERRLDNVIYRLGFAESRAQARQVVRHGHIMLNGKKDNIPSSLIDEGDTISFPEHSKKLESYKLLLEAIKSKPVPNWLSLDRENLVGKVLALPTPEDAQAKFAGKTIVEYYSR
ncbi:MAG: 30S ribosomal protein S4 [Chloroflexota bacterium]